MVKKNEVMEKLRQEFGDGRGLLAHQVLMLSMSGQPCDVTFFKSPPALDVKIDQQISLALMYRAGATKLQEMFDAIRLSDGQTVSFGEMWVVLPMPQGGLTESQLAEVDLALGEEKSGPNGETVREMIRNIYHCKSREEEDRFLRRYLAS